jgi:eukaryotic-like serine/threonine-protein kinase
MESSKNKRICKNCNHGNPDYVLLCEECEYELENSILTTNSGENQRPSSQPNQPPSLAPKVEHTDDDASSGEEVSTSIQPEPVPVIQRVRSWMIARRDARQSPKSILIAIASVILAGICIVGYLIYPYLFLHHDHVPTSPTPMCTVYPIPANGIGVCLDDSGGKDKENIGLSDGSYALDVGNTNERSGSADKINGAAAFRKGQWDIAHALWSQARTEDTSDAEAGIYLENLRVLNAHHPYLTVVIGAVLADFPIDYSSRDQLQGAYVAQKTYNDQAIQRQNGVLLKLLVAKSGNNVEQSKLITQFILKAKEQDKTIVAVLGWTKTAQSGAVLPLLDQAHIPLVSATATGDTLTDTRSPYFFRVVPPNKAQVPLLVNYIENHFTIHHLVAFFDDSDPFSQNFVEDFQQKYTRDGHAFAFEMKDYRTLESDADFSQHVKAILQYNPDAVLLETRASDDVIRFLKALPPSFAKLKIFADASVYPIANAAPGTYKNADTLSFVSPAFPDEWGVLGYGPKTPTFCKDYAAAFDPGDKTPPCGIYGYSRPDAYAMLAYDGMGAILEAISRAQKAHGGETAQISTDDVQKGLKTITAASPFQGITGQIAFGPDGDPVDKEVLMLSVLAAPGKSPGLNIVDHTGCFLVQEMPGCKSKV